MISINVIDMMIPNKKTQIEVLVQRLKELQKTIAAAESCTGGLLGKSITDIPGSSAVFPGELTDVSAAYGVDQELLDTLGPVSEPVARQMAEGVRRVIGADLGVGITGIAGPDGGTPEKPVGTVWIAVASAAHTEAKLLQFGANRRQQNIDRSTNQAYAMLIRLLNQ